MNDMPQPIRTEHFRIIGGLMSGGYRVASIHTHLGWSFHTTGELEYLIGTLTDELRSLLQQVVLNPGSGVIENRITRIAANVSYTPTGLALRYAIFKRDSYRCQICGRSAHDGITLEIDHKIPRSKCGTDDPGNLWVLCFDCNRGKSDSDL